VPSTAENILRPHMPELDSLRGLAILLVLFYHGFASSFSPDEFSGPARLVVIFTSYGWVGVDLFFVLSGFLITGILLDSRWRPDYYRRFYIRRALRILPIYYALLLTLAITTRTRLFGHPLPWSFVAISFLFLANFVTLFKIASGYAVLWSLAVEEHFYLLWPAVVRRFSAAGVAICALAVCVACPLLRASSFLLHRGLGWNDYGAYTWLVADGLATGALFAVAARGALSARNANWKLVGAAFGLSVALGIAGWPVGILSREHLLGFTLRQTALNIFFLGVLVLALLIGTGPWKRWVNFKPLRWLGEISYGVYLIHTLIFWFVDRSLRIWLPGLPALDGHFGWIAGRFGIAFAVTIAVSYVSRWYFEERFLRLKEKISA
jgi:peptidoglycan/LPS O-acetylase OafA/YrhL